MALLQLPQELLDHILDPIIADDGFRSFVLTCKTAHRVCKSLIERYNAQRRAWRAIPAGENTKQCVSALDIVEAIVQDPEIAWFVETLDLSLMPDLDHHVDDQHWKIDNGMVLEHARQLVLDSPAIKAAVQDPGGWMLAVDDDHDTTMLAIANAARLKESETQHWLHTNASYNLETQHNLMQVSRTIILLTLLPNLKELTLPNSWGYITGEYSDGAPRYFMDLMNSMVHQARRTSGRTLPLSKLRILHPYEDIDYQYSPKSGLTEIAPFTILPRLTDVTMTNLIAVKEADDHYDRSSDEAGLTFKWPYESDVASNVRSLRLHGCCMDATGIGELLPHMPHLDQLLYTHHPKYRGVGTNWRAGEFINVIQEHCCKTLKQLYIGGFNSGRPYWGAPLGRVASLKKFAVLETLRIPISLFRDTEGLSDILPSSLRRLGLIASIDDLEESYDRLSQPGFPKGHPAFKKPEAIRSLGLESFEVFVHESEYSNGDMESLRANTQLDELRAAGAQLVEADHSRGSPCMCMTRGLQGIIADNALGRRMQYM